MDKDAILVQKLHDDINANFEHRLQRGFFEHGRQERDVNVATIIPRIGAKINRARLN
jgi:hypothetical protein